MKDAAGKVGGWLARNAFLLVAFLAIAGSWTYTHLFPYSFGTCREVPLNLGAKATIRDCQALTTADFLVPVLLVVLLVLLISSDDIEFTMPFIGGSVKRNRRAAKEAAETLKQETGSGNLDERGEKFLDTLPSTDPGAEGPPP